MAGGDLTTLIEASRAGDAQARDQLFSLVYEDLRQIARRQLYVGRPGDTMQATALANEAYLEISRRFPSAPLNVSEGRATFFRTVALAMRTLLRDEWLRKKTQKRGGGKLPVSLGALDLPAPPSDGSQDRADFLAVDDAMSELEHYNPRWYEVVMYRHFAGRSIEQTAELMGVGTTTVKKYQKLGEAWLRRRLGVAGR